MTLKNHILCSANLEEMTDIDGQVTDMLLKLYYELTLGRAGLIITGVSSVCADGRARIHQIGVWSDSHIDGLNRLSTVIHKYGTGCKCAVQLHHAGELSYLNSSQQKNDSLHNPQIWNLEKTKQVISSFGEAAKRVKKAGFDAVTVHGAHGYLMSQFLSSALNKRTDDWGGALINRMRFPLKVCTAIREQVGADFPYIMENERL